jgi:hypothetical protein
LWSQLQWNRADTPEQVVKFAPKERPRSYGTPAEEPGQATIAKIQKADDLSNENCDRATALAQRLSMQFRAGVRPESSLRQARRGMALAFDASALGSA